MTLEPDAPIEWLRSDAPASDVVITSRVRLARNFAGYPFTGRADTSERAQIMRMAQSHILDADLAPKVMWVDITELSETERRVLVERHLISANHAEGDQPRAVAVSSPGGATTRMWLRGTAEARHPRRHRSAGDGDRTLTTQ